MKYKVGDKVRIVKINYEDDIKTKDCIGKVYEVSTICKNDRGYGLYGNCSVWKEDELELAKESIFDKLAHSIVKAAKEANILVEPTEDGGIKISPLEEKEEDFAVDTPCMVSHYGDINFMLRYYAGNKECYDSGNKSKSFHHLESWNYIIPFDRFNPNNIEESIKYNIVK